MANIRYIPNPDFEKELAKDLAPAMRRIAAERTRQYDVLIAAHRGGDLDDVKAELARIYEDAGGSIADPDLKEHAEMIVAGQRIVFEPEQ